MKNLKRTIAIIAEVILPNTAFRCVPAKDFILSSTKKDIMFTS